MVKKYSSLTREIHIRNMISRFRRLIGAVPEVGIFWVDLTNPEHLIWGFKTPLNEAETWEGNKIYPGDHDSSWLKMQRLNPKWRYNEYFEIPRGRIVYFAAPERNVFRVYLPKKLKKNEAVKQAIIGVFNIPSSNVEFNFEDLHYQI